MRQHEFLRQYNLITPVLFHQASALKDSQYLILPRDVYPVPTPLIESLNWFYFMHSLRHPHNRVGGYTFANFCLPLCHTVCETCQVHYPPLLPFDHFLDSLTHVQTLSIIALPAAPFKLHYFSSCDIKPPNNFLSTVFHPLQPTEDLV